MYSIGMSLSKQSKRSKKQQHIFVSIGTPTDKQAIAKTMLKNTIGMISNLAAASTILGGKSINKKEENSTVFTSVGVALARIKLDGMPTPGLNTFSNSSPIITATETLSNT